MDRHSPKVCSELFFGIAKKLKGFILKSKKNNNAYLLQYVQKDFTNCTCTILRIAWYCSRGQGLLKYNFRGSWKLKLYKGMEPTKGSLKSKLEINKTYQTV